MTRQTIKIDATGQTVGRLATKIAVILRGKNKVDFEPRIDGGDIVEITNVGKLKFTGTKIDQKKYYHFSNYPGGLKTKKMSEVFEKNPGHVLRHAVRDMLPPIKFRSDMLKRLIIK